MGINLSLINNTNIPFNVYNNASPIDKVSNKSNVTKDSTSPIEKQSKANKDGYHVDINSKDKESYKSNTYNSYDELSVKDKKILEQLKQADAEVTAHEQAHVAAGGQYITSGTSYEYTRGPDGNNYAVGGEVSIDTSVVPSDPQATINKMQAVRRAALAPASPSGQDRMVAAKASQTEAKARLELAAMSTSEANKQGEAQHLNNTENSYNIGKIDNDIDTDEINKTDNSNKKYVADQYYNQYSGQYSKLNKGNLIDIAC